MARVKKTPEALAFVIICFGQEVTHVTSAYNSLGLAQTQVNLESTMLMVQKIRELETFRKQH